MSMISLLASLPPLEFEVTPQMSLEEILESCQTSLEDQELNRLNAWLAPEHRPLGQLSGKWRDYRRSLNHELAQARAKRLRRGNEGISLEQFPLAPIMDLEEILQAANPLKSQTNYFFLLWSEAAHLEALADWNLEKLGLYCIRLAMADKMSRYQQKEGEARLNDWLEHTLQPDSLELAWRA